MKTMTYEEAKKAVAGIKSTPTNYLVIDFKNSCKLVLPHKEGAAVINALSQAEELMDSWSSRAKGIQPLDMDTVTVSVMSRKDYERHKIAALMNISMHDLEEIERNASNQGD